MKTKQVVLLILASLSLYSSGALCSHASDTSAVYWDGQSYFNNSTVQSSQAKHLIDQIHFTGNEKVLDVGCGDGKITLAIANLLKNGGSVEGIDLSSSMLKMAKSLIKEAKVSNASFSLVDVLKLSYVDQFDKIVSFSTFHWIADQGLAFKKIHNALKPGGRAYFLFNGDHGKKAPLEISTERAIQHPRWNTFLNNKGSGVLTSTPSFLVGAIEKANLILNRFEVIRMDEIFENRLAFMNWITGWMTSLKYLQLEDRPNSENEIIDDYLKQVPLLKDGKILFYEYIMEIEVEKKTVLPI